MPEIISTTPPDNLRHAPKTTYAGAARRRVEAAAMLRAGMSPREVSEKCGRSLWWARDVARVAKVVYPHATRYTADHDYFSVIDTEAKAYWLGFLTADGCVSGSVLQLGLQRNDSEHVRAFRDALGSDVPLRQYSCENKSGRVTYSSRVSLTSSQMVADLARHGLTERKSLTARPWSGPPELLRHYWRGVVDGDGWIITDGGKLNLGLVGSRAVVDAFRLYATTITKFGATVRPKKSVWVLQLASVASKAVVCHLYEDAAVFLARKKAKADLARAMTFCPIRSFPIPTRDGLIAARARHRSWYQTGLGLGMTSTTVMKYARLYGLVD